MADNNSDTMEFEAHRATYEGFVNIAKISALALFNVLLCLIMFTFGGTAGSIFGWVMVFALLIAAAIGMALGSRGWIPGAAVFVLSGILAILTSAG
ncbi:aa3-type cytochrome c oxidase subunit IV [Rhizobiales bacterium]|uniref:aa3-type cytochrome c oxidase subunit IV n=1 Tax=Hongsoonwoonella zoysiae TaxID=2821844 RepID=UPI001560A5FE|nr:aa3-type cytochrome c oxidase subunit IV [Hongsoonwoonella zoysiae]NRG17306.1 aa3-type cytochrome c oxidase subunit IV [Hongsoonwoonella zoysiae]